MLLKVKKNKIIIHTNYKKEKLKSQKFNSFFSMLLKVINKMIIHTSYKIEKLKMSINSFTLQQCC